MNSKRSAKNSDPPCLQGETTDAYALRLLEYVGEMSSEMRAVEDRVRALIAAAPRSQ